MPSSRDHFPLMIPGAQASGAPIEVLAPYDRSIIATADVADHQTIDRALDIATELFKHRERWLPVTERIAILEKTSSLFKKNAEMLACEAAREGGKPLIDSRVEVARAIDCLRICVEELRTKSGRVIPMNVNQASRGRRARTSFEPIGPVVAISAFNHPVNLIAHQVGPAVASGCPVIIKPAENTPLSCFRFVSILREAGLPEEWCQALLTKDHAVAQALVTDPRVAFFSFIGSAKVGWMLRSKLAPGTRCALEHGGVAPVIVAPDADLDDALPLLAKGGYYHAGQVCVSVQRVFAHESLAADLAERLATRAKKMTIGDPTSDKTDVGPLIRPSEVDRVESWVHEAIEGGAECLSGGERLSDTCYACTLLYKPPHDSKVMTQEIFGPVICVVPYSDIDEAIAQANSLPYAFQASVFSRDFKTAHRTAARLDASAVMINDHTAFRVDWMPFAGLKHSGLGVGGIPYTMHDMQTEKMVVVRSPID